MTTQTAFPMSELKMSADAKHIDMDAEEYHAFPAVSSGALEDFRESRRLYEGRHILGTIPKRQPTLSMQLGTWTHMRILEPDRYLSLLADPLPDTAPDGKKWLRRKGSDHEKWWADELAQREGKIAINTETRDRIEAMAKSVLSKRWAARLLQNNGKPEYSIFWTDQETGLRCKCLVDWFSSISIDIKTTVDPSPAAFARTCVQFAYHRKRAHYIAGLQALTGEKDSVLLHMAVGTEPPFSSGAYEIIDTDRYTNRSLGYMEWRHTLKALAKAISENDFADPWESEVLSLELPSWAFTQQQYQI